MLGTVKRISVQGHDCCKSVVTGGNTMGALEDEAVDAPQIYSEIEELNGYKKSRNSSESSGDDSLDDIEYILRDPQLIRKEKFKLMKNLLLICLAFMCNFTAFGGASTLQSSLNSDQGLGTASLAIIYGALIVSAMFTPTIIIKHLGCRWTICAAIIGYVTYPLANFYPHWGTLVPSSIIVGFSAAPLWSAKCAYLTTSAKRYARLTKETTDTVVNRFFGIFFLFFQFNNIIGQLISSFVLSSADSSNLIFPNCYNETYIKSYCGARDCQDDLEEARAMFNVSCDVSSSSGSEVEDWTLYTLMGIYAGVGFTGSAIVAIFVDNISIRQNETRGFFDLLIATFKHMKDRRQILLIVITMYSGFEQAFLTGDFTRSFVTCPLAVNWVGFVLICYGACDSACSFLFGRVEKYTGRLPLFTMAFLINLALIIVFQLWIPYPDTQTLFFLLPAFWGIADAVWQTQLNALYGVLFVTNQEASFANYRLWESLGFVIAFAYQSFICVSAKLWVLLGVLLVGISLYYYVEFTERKKKNSVDRDSDSEKDYEINEAYLDSRKSMSKAHSTKM
ncbi:protein unc-93 homolog A-like isoform X2 [Clavelina lepadiformis]|uniref:protein unc-93 homolog A-like isoform X2 n=1 Tax=Clavelina lepadiformis TaxID=159417 RepID=UPI0040432D23